MIDPALNPENLLETTDVDNAYIFSLDEATKKASSYRPAAISSVDAVKLKRVPRHLGFIPDGNRRGTEARG